MKCLSTSGAFGKGVFAFAIDTSPLVTDEALENKYEETETRLRKIENCGYKVISKWEFRKLLREILALKINFARTPIWRTPQ